MNDLDLLDDLSIFLPLLLMKQNHSAKANVVYFCSWSFFTETISLNLLQITLCSVLLKGGKKTVRDECP